MGEVIGTYTIVLAPITGAVHATYVESVRETDYGQVTVCCHAERASLEEAVARAPNGAYVIDKTSIRTLHGESELIHEVCRGPLISPLLVKGTVCADPTTGEIVPYVWHAVDGRTPTTVLAAFKGRYPSVYSVSGDVYARLLWFMGARVGVVEGGEVDWWISPGAGVEDGLQTFDVR